MNKKGVSLVELLGALVILSIVLALSALILNFFIQANKRISINTQANYEGNLVVRNIEEDLLGLEPTTYDSCPGSCYIISKEFSYELNTDSQQVELIIYSSPETYEIEINKQVLYINAIPYEFDNFELGSDSSINMYKTKGVNYL